MPVEKNVQLFSEQDPCLKLEKKSVKFLGIKQTGLPIIISELKTELFTFSGDRWCFQFLPFLSAESRSFSHDSLVV